MATKRQKRPTGVLKTREDLERCLGEYSRLTIERDALAAEMDERIRQVRASYEERLSDLVADTETEFEMAADWAARNPEAFGARKSLDLTHGTLGYRTGMPQLKTRKGVTWSSVLMLLTTLRRTDWIRTKCEPDREKLLADRERLGPEWLAEIGVEVRQDETFFVEPKRDANL
jgi:phage host-nuclease inhibitor protein Gam